MNKNDKFIKTQKKLPDLKMGEIGVNPKNMTFSSDSEDPNLVSEDQSYSFVEVATDDQGRTFYYNSDN